MLEFAAFIQLRRIKPDMPRPFKVFGGMPVAVALVTPPTILGVFAMGMCRLETHIAGLVVMAVGVVLYHFIQRLKEKNLVAFETYVPIDQRPTGNPVGEEGSCWPGAPAAQKDF